VSAVLIMWINPINFYSSKCRSTQQQFRFFPQTEARSSIRIRARFYRHRVFDIVLIVIPLVTFRFYRNPIVLIATVVDCSISHRVVVVTTTMMSWSVFFSQGGRIRRQRQYFVLLMEIWFLMPVLAYGALSSTDPAKMSPDPRPSDQEQLPVPRVPPNSKSHVSPPQLQSHVSPPPDGGRPIMGPKHDGLVTTSELLRRMPANSGTRTEEGAPIPVRVPEFVGISDAEAETFLLNLGLDLSGVWAAWVRDFSQKDLAASRAAFQQHVSDSVLSEKGINSLGEDVLESAARGVSCERDGSAVVQYCKGAENLYEKVQKFVQQFPRGARMMVRLVSECCGTCVV
jgi:hypothetical protein